MKIFALILLMFVIVPPFAFAVFAYLALVTDFVHWLGEKFIRK